MTTATPPTPPPDWPTVEAWMIAEKAGYKKTAAFWGVSVDWVKSRARTARKKGGGPPPIPPLGSRGPGVAWTAPFAKHAPPKDPHPAVLTAATVAALTPDTRRDIRSGTRGITRALAAADRRMDEYEAAEIERARLKAEGLAQDVIDERAPLPKLPDMRSADSGVRALIGLTQFAPLLAALDEATGGVSGSAGPTDAERAKARALMLADDPPPRALSVVDGGRASTG